MNQPTPGGQLDSRQPQAEWATPSPSGHRLPRLFFFGVVALVFLAGFGTARFLGQENPYMIVIGNKPVAVLSSEQEAQEALAGVLCDRAGDWADRAQFTQPVAIRKAKRGAGDSVSSPEAQQLLGSKVGVVVPAYWLVVKGKPLLALASRAEVDETMRKLVRQYLPKNAKLVSRPILKEKVALRKVTLSPTGARQYLVKPDRAVGVLTAPSVSPRDYTVRRGETASAVANRFDIGLADLLKANPYRNLNRLKPGDTIIVTGGPPPLTLLFSAQEAVKRDVPYWTERVPDASLSRGEKIVLQSGLPGKQIFITTTNYVNGLVVSQICTADKVLVGPVPERVAVSPRELRTRDSEPRRHRSHRRHTARRAADYAPPDNPLLP